MVPKARNKNKKITGKDVIARELRKRVFYANDELKFLIIRFHFYFVKFYHSNI